MKERVAKTISRPEFPHEAATLRLAVNAATLGVWQWDILQNTFEYNSHGRALYGFTADEEITYEKLRVRTHPADVDMASATLRRAIDPAVRSKEPYEYRIVRSEEHTSELQSRLH